MYLGDNHVLLNTLCWCCHRKIWLQSGEACYCCRTGPSRPWDECPDRAGAPWIDTQRSSSLGMEPMVLSCWEEALSLENWLPLKSKFLLHSCELLVSSAYHDDFSSVLSIPCLWNISKGERMGAIKNMAKVVKKLSDFWWGLINFIFQKRKCVYLVPAACVTPPTSYLAFTARVQTYCISYLWPYSNSLQTCRLEQHTRILSQFLWVSTT